MKKILALFLVFILVISGISCSFFVSTSAASDNLWKKISSSDVVRFSAPHIGLNSTDATGFSIWNPEYSYYCIKMPSLNNGVTYKFSCAVYSINADVDIVDFAILNQSEFEQARSNVANYYSFPGTATKLVQNKKVTPSATTIPTYEFTADGSQYYLGFRCGGSSNKNGVSYLFVSNISLTADNSNTISVVDGVATVDGVPVSKAEAGQKINLSFNDSVDKAFEKWEVLSGNVVLEDATNPNTTFTMPDESIVISAKYNTNIWTTITNSDVKSYSGYGDFTSYTENNKELKMHTMFWQSVSVKLPELKKNSTYKISFKRSFGNTIQGGSAANLSNITINLISQTQHNAAGGTIPSTSVKQLCNSNSLSEYVSTEFTTTKTDTTYYMAIQVNGTYGDLILSGLSLQVISLAPDVDDYYQDPSNWGMYSNTIVDGTGSQKSGWQGISVATDKINSGLNSLKIEGNGTYFAVPLEMDNLEVGKQYIVKFKYYIPEGATLFNNNSWFDHIAVIKSGTSVDANGMPMIADVFANGTISTWNSMSIKFNVTDDAQLFFGIRTGMGAGSQYFYMDEIKVQEAPDNVYEDYENWGIYANSVIDGSGFNQLDWQQVSKSTTQVNKGNHSLSIEGDNTFFAVPIEMNKLVVGKLYTIKFKYYIPEGATKCDGESWFDHLSVVKAGTSVDEYGIPITDNVLASGSLATWNSMSVTFEVPDNTQLFFGFRAAMGEGVKQFYIDDISIDLAVDNAYEDAANWGMYSNSKIDGTGPNKVEWQHAANTTSQVKTGNHSLKVEGNGKFFAVPLEMDKLTIGKNYVIKFYYYIPEGANMFNNASWFDSISIVKEGTTTDAYGNVPDGGIIANGTVASWNLMEITFKVTDDTQLFFGFRTGMGAGSQYFYIDEFTLTQGVGSNVLHPEPADVLMVDFEKDFNYNFNPADRMAVEQTKGRNGKTTKALHIFEGVYTSTTFPNWDTVRSDKDLIFSFPVKEYCAYEVSVWVKVDSLNKENAYSSLFLFYDYDSEDYNANQIAYATYNDIYNKGWQEYKISFVAEKGQDYASFALDASFTPSSLWIDDIVYKEIKPGFISDTKLSYCEDYYNLALQSNVDINKKITKNTTIKIPVSKSALYTVGVDLFGSGRVIFSLDAEGTKVIKTVLVSKTQNRIGYNLWLSALDGGLYIHFKPENTGIEYQNLHLFASKAISLNFDMGYEENPNQLEKKYTPIRVNGDFLETDNHDTTADGFSPQTGDICNVTSVVVLLVVSIFAVIIASKKRKNLITKTQ